MMAGGFEGENPTRRYKWFRPRQAARGAILFSGAMNTAVCGLYNDSTASQFVVLRAVLFDNQGGGTPDGLAYYQGQPGTAGGVITPLLPGGAKLPGLLFTWNTATTIAPDILMPVLDNQVHPDATWLHDFPFAVLPPGWSIVTTNQGGLTTMSLSAVWEAIYSDELDYLY